MKFLRKRVFLLGPSHHFYLTGCALSRFAYYSTPMGDLELDQDVMAKLYETKKFDMMKTETDEDEHSMELHLPYIYKILPKATLVPILVGNTSPETEVEFGQILLPFVKDPENVFVISSDFAHWGLRFSYTNYLDDEMRILRASDKVNKPIWKSIDKIDRMTMEAIKTGEHEEFWKSLRKTGNTVCGRHPIGIIMAALESLDSRFQFIQYTRSSDCVKVSDSSVSYVSAYAVVDI
jgi:MEMO1 family protein